MRNSRTNTVRSSRRSRPVGGTMVESVHEAWLAAVEDLRKTVFFRRLREGEPDIRHYRALLREIYYNTRENPASFALMAWHLKGKQRDIAKRIFRHCAAEQGHHDLALADLRALGADVAADPGGQAPSHHGGLPGLRTLSCAAREPPRLPGLRLPPRDAARDFRRRDHLPVAGRGSAGRGHELPDRARPRRRGPQPLDVRLYPGGHRGCGGFAASGTAL